MGWKVIATIHQEIFCKSFQIPWSYLVPTPKKKEKRKRKRIKKTKLRRRGTEERNK
jgi:hypothetical protein